MARVDPAGPPGARTADGHPHGQVPAAPLAGTGAPGPTAARLPRPRWRDTRLLLGLLLVLGSVLLGAKVFAEADQRVQVWSVTRDLGADTELAAGDVAVRSVRLDATARRYLSADEPVEGLVLDRPVGRGELLPVGSLRAGSAGGERRLVVIAVDRFSARGLAKGGVVDVYGVPEGRAGQADAAQPGAATTGPEPALVLRGVTVAEDPDRGGSRFGGSGSSAGLTLSVPEADVPELLAAVAGGSVHVVAVP